MTACNDDLGCGKVMRKAAPRARAGHFRFWAIGCFQEFLLSLSTVQIGGHVGRLNMLNEEMNDRDGIDSDSEAEMIDFVIASLFTEETADVQKQREENLRKKKEKWVAGPSG
ncbi:Uncharacterized protein Fot_32430 [Forsythia ovata]|uniref:Uncharacterized protein n=1 Tax=Forsythia ovata TaxID=205694 RepID=A0ABD1T7S4_9LAMI